MMRWRTRGAAAFLFVLVACAAACSRPAGEASSIGVAPSEDPLPGPELRARLEGLADCWMTQGAPSGQHPWQRIGGLCNRTMHRASSSVELSLSMVFPQGPDGPITATEGYARFTAERDQVKVVLLVHVPASPEPHPYSTLELARDYTAVATIGLPRKDVAMLGSPEALERAWHAAIDRANDPGAVDLSRRRECRVLPPANPGAPGRGQECDWVPTTDAERLSMADGMRARASELRAWVTTKRDVILTLANELYPYSDAECAARATQE